MQNEGQRPDQAPSRTMVDISPVAGAADRLDTGAANQIRTDQQAGRDIQDAMAAEARNRQQELVDQARQAVAADTNPTVPGTITSDGVPTPNTEAGPQPDVPTYSYAPENQAQLGEQAPTAAAEPAHEWTTRGDLDKFIRGEISGDQMASVVDPMDLPRPAATAPAEGQPSIQPAPTYQQQEALAYRQEPALSQPVAQPKRGIFGRMRGWFGR